jgi:hypothetical protein
MPQLLSEFLREFNSGHGGPRAIPIDWREFDGPYHSPTALRDEPEEPGLFASLRRIHESAHAVVGHVLGLKVNFIDTRRSQARCSLSGAGNDGAAAYLVSLAASKAAQKRYGATDVYYDGRCGADDQDIEETVRELTVSEADARQMIAAIRKAADRAVAEYWSDILWLASALERLDDYIGGDEMSILRHIGAERLVVRRGFIPPEAYWTRKGLSGPRGYNSETREIDAVISTGARVRRNGWDGPFDEVLDMSPKAVRLARLNQGGPVLNSHNWYAGVGAMLGGIVPGSARLEDGALVARIKFSRASELAQRVVRDLEDGIQIPLSAGYKIHRVIEDRKTNPVTRTAVDWEPVEVSLVPIAAEETGTGFRARV